MKTIKLGIMLMILALSSCAVLDHESSKPLDRNAKWALLPIVNHTDVPQAGLRAETITEVLLRTRGIGMRELTAELRARHADRSAAGPRNTRGAQRIL